MFKFFTQKEWRLWSWVGSFIILSSLWVQVQIDVKINEWFGQFYDMIQKALAAPNSITIGEYWASLLSFITLALSVVFRKMVASYQRDQELQIIDNVPIERTWQDLGLYPVLCQSHARDDIRRR
jgi:ABC-type long-subunit fatty acid transport system fused permease/ATPase subunit